MPTSVVKLLLDLPVLCPRWAGALDRASVWTSQGGRCVPVWVTHSTLPDMLFAHMAGAGLQQAPERHETVVAAFRPLTAT